jgi:hypothetical protein
MKFVVFIVFIIFSCAELNAQVSDAFSDGDFTSNPVWTPDATTNGTVINNQLRSNSSFANSTFYISTPSAQALNAQWEFYVNLQFNTSSANYVDVYLTSSNATMTGANGYFVRIGGTPDEISLYKSTAGTSSILINGTDGITNVLNNVLKIKVIRNASNVWSLQRDITGTGNNYVSEGTVTDNTFTTSTFFGLHIAQSTSSFFSKHFFDDFYVGPIILDNAPPIANSVSVVSSSELILTFNEILDITSAQTSANYLVDNSIGKPTSAILQADLKTVKLTFALAFGNGIQNQLTASGIKDVAGNVMTSIALPFVYFLAAAETKNDIIISEIFPDPDPIIGLPSGEFIELYNRSSNPFDLSGWKLSDGVSTAIFSLQIILPQQYWIVTSSTNAALFSAFTNVIGVSNFPSLNNSGDLLTLRSSNGLTIDSLNYALSWYRDADKQQGGWSLERIGLNKSSIDPTNWIASQDGSGGTPGKQNSWFGKNPDVIPPKLLSLTVKNDSQLELTFDEAIDPTTILISNFVVNNGIGSPTSFQLSSDAKSVILTFNSKFQNGLSNQITIANITDIVGNKIQPLTSTFYYLISTLAKAQDIIISEIFPDPDPIIGLPSAEFIELYNRSNNPFDLSEWKLSDGISTATFNSQIILPQQYWIVTSSTNAALFSNFINVIGVSNFPSLNNSGDLITLRSSSGLTIDSLNYALSWYRDADKQQGGWSLERIDLNKSSTDPTNWIASQDGSGGTPGKQNSWFGKNPDTQAPKLLSLVVKNNSQLELTFNEGIDPTSTTISNFSVSNGIGNPISFQLSSDAKSVLLTFNSKFQNGVENSLSISLISDVVGNNVSSVSQNFTFIIVSPSTFKDILITEILADPTPAVGLPDGEFIELFNRSKIPFDLFGWSFQAGKSITLFAHQIILPQQYLIVTNAKGVVKFLPYGKIASMIDFPTLTNEGQSIQLKNEKNQTIDSVNYSIAWYRNSDKAEGGWSLELIDPNNICGEQENWNASESNIGGTPGKQNSVLANKPDLTGPKLESILPEKGNVLLLSFDEKLDITAVDIDKYNIYPSVNIIKVYFTDLSKRQVRIELQLSLQKRQLYSLSLQKIYDCAGNEIQKEFNQLSFALPEEVEPSDILINEILFNPQTGGVDFVEVYNNSPKYISLNDCKLSNVKSGVLKNIQPIISQSLLEPNQYRVFTPDPSILKNNYPQGEERKFVKITLPSLPNDAGSIAIVSKNGIVIDSFFYNKNFHSTFIKDDQGVSLERISFGGNSNDANNWKSASSQSHFATPGYQNSNARSADPLLSEKVNIDPEIIIPNSGYQDFAKINYTFDQNNFIANVKILDEQGRLIKVIANNETLGYSGFFRWDGNMDDGSKARIGYYIVWIDLFDETGAVNSFRKRIIVTSP